MEEAYGLPRSATRQEYQRRSEPLLPLTAAVAAGRRPRRRARPAEVAAARADPTGAAASGMGPAVPASAMETEASDPWVAASRMGRWRWSTARRTGAR